MAQDMGRGIIAPEPNDNISTTGVQEMRTLGATAAAAIGTLQTSVMQEIEQLPTTDDITQLEDNLGQIAERANLPLHTAQDGDDLNDFIEPQIISKSSSRTIHNQPIWDRENNDTSVIVVLVINTDSGYAAQVAFIYGGTPQAAWRVQRNTSGLWQPWQMIRAIDPHLDDAAFRREDIVSRARARRGGPIGTNGRPAVALRFDHHTGDWATKVLPLLEERGIPWAQIINPTRVSAGSHGDTYGYDQLQDAALRSGGEIWNHGGNHNDFTLPETAVREIPEALKTIQENMPRLAIEGWAPPGLSAGGYMGAAPFATTAQNTGTYPGQLIMRNHAFIAGYAPGTYRTLDPDTTHIGASHMTIDQSNPGQVRRAIDALGQDGLALMLHPNYLDQSGYLSTADLIAVFDDIVTRRDAGELQVLSYSGLWLADARSQYRDNLFSGLDQTVIGEWTGEWSPYRRENRLGSIREIHCEVLTPSSTTVTIAATYGAETITQSRTISGSSSWQKITGMITLPLDLGTPLEVSINPGSGVQQRGQALYAV